MNRKCKTRFWIDKRTRRAIYALCNHPYINRMSLHYEYEYTGCPDIYKELCNGHNFSIICNWMSIFRQNLHKMIPCEHLKDVWYKVSLNSIFFFKVAITKKFGPHTKTSIFQTNVKLINLYFFFSFRPFCDPGASK